MSPLHGGNLDSLHAWTIRAPCETGGWHITDSGDLYVLRATSDGYTAYGCNAPLARRVSNEGARIARSLYEYFEAVTWSVWPHAFPPQ